MSHGSLPRRGACVAFGLLAALVPLRAGDLPWALEDELVAVLQERIGRLAPHQRGTISKGFEPAGEDAYRVSLTIDHAGDERMKTERLLVTLAKPAGRWTIAEEQVVDTYEGLVRDVAGDEKAHRFSGLRLEREGLLVEAGSGTCVTDFVLGEVFEIHVAAPDLRYRYAPPAGGGRHRDMVFGMLRNGNPADLAFDPEVLVIECDPASCAELLGSAFRDLEEIGADGLDRTLAAHLEEVAKKRAEGRAKDPFSGFALPPDRRRYALRLERKGDDHRLGLEYDEAASFEVQFSATSLGTLFGYPAAESLRAADPREIEARDDLETRDFHVRAIRGRVELATELPELLEADLEFTLVPKRELREVFFEFNDIGGWVGKSQGSSRVTVDLLRDGDGADLTWVRLGDTAGLIVLPAPAPAGVELPIRMRFRNAGSILKLSPSYSYMDRGGWLPFVRYTDSIERIDLTLDVPSRFKVLGIGARESEETLGKVTRTRWVTDRPVHFPTVIFGDYVEDAPRSRAEKRDGTPIPVRIHVDRDGKAQWGIRTNQLQPIAELAVNALNVYRELYGLDYPYEKLDLVNDPQFIAGQAPASVIYLGSGVFRSDAALSAVAAADLSGTAESLVSHEVAHQWWGSAIGTVNHNNYWFVESLAEYSAALFIEILESGGYQNPEKGRRAYLQHVAGWRQRIFDSNLACSVQDARTLWSNQGYQTALYAKGPYAFHILRSMFGDEKMFLFLKALGQELGGQAIVTRDIQRVAERAFGGVDAQGKPYSVDLEWFFDQWIRGIGMPEYRFEHAVRQAEDGTWVVSGTVRQRVLLGKQRAELPGVYFRGAVPVAVRGADKKEYAARLVVEGATTEFSFKVPVKPQHVELNPNGEILAYPVLDASR